MVLVWYLYGTCTHTFTIAHVNWTSATPHSHHAKNLADQTVAVAMSLTCPQMLVEMVSGDELNHRQESPVDGGCADGVHNGDEEGIDCGGSCLNECSHCDDGLWNGDELAVDCGGACGLSRAWSCSDIHRALREHVAAAAKVCNRPSNRCGGAALCDVSSGNLTEFGPCDVGEECQLVSQGVAGFEDVGM